MIDPLSLATSVLTLTDAAVRIGHFISRCRNAPAELMALNNEINDLRYVLTRIRDVYPPDAKGDISAILDRASEKADQLSVVVQLLEGEENGKLSTYQRLKWSAMKHKVSRSRGDLRELRLQLNVFLAAENVNETFQTGLTVKELCFISQSTSDQLTEMRQDLANQLHILKQAQQTEKILFEDISVNVELAHYNIQKGAVKAGKSLEPTSEQISISVRQFEGCHVSCSCICHKKSRLSTPSFLNNIFGSLFVEYTGTPLGKLKCSLGSCRSRTAVPSTHFTYYFPQWFLSAAVDVTILRGTFGEPSAALAVKNVRDRDHDLFKAVYRGDLPHLRDLFTHGKARPSDIDEFGHTLLTKAVQRTNAETCQFLLNMGVDPYYENVYGVSAFDSAWKTILMCTSSQSEQLAGVFSDKERLDVWNLSPFHKVMFKLSLGSVQDQLCDPTVEWDVADSNGRTPLWWAAARGDYNTANALLSRGANVSASDCEGDSPLHAALYSPKRYKMLRLLLSHGARTSQGNKRGCITPHHAVHHHDDLTYVKMLLGPNVDINTRAGPFDETLLGIASRKNHFHVVQYLLAQNADVNLANNQGTVPVMDSLYFNCHEALSILLTHGAAVNGKTKQGETILHLAALYGDKETFLILTLHHAAREMDLKAQTKAGFTAFDLYSRRECSTADENAFFGLILTNPNGVDCLKEYFPLEWLSVPAPTWHPSDVRSHNLVEEEDEWYDCYEIQEF